MSFLWQKHDFFLLLYSESLIVDDWEKMSEKNLWSGQKAYEHFQEKFV